MKPQLALVAALAVSCSKAPHEEISDAGHPPTREATKVCYCDECDPSVVNTLTASPDAVLFCQELADVRDAVLGVTSTDLTVRFKQPVNEFYHKAGTVTCAYGEDVDELTGKQRAKVLSVVIKESDIGNPDGDYHGYFDDHVQDSAGKPLRDKDGQLKLGADGILDSNTGGGNGGLSCTWKPTNAIFPFIQQEYADRVKFLRDQLHAGTLLPRVNLPVKVPGEK